MTFLNRQMHEILVQAASLYPVVTLTGPRQSGKTTLVKLAFPQKQYVSMEDPAMRDLAETDPYGFFARYPDGTIIDEIQHTPHLLSYIQTIVDERKVKGQFIITGSQQFNLMAGITQSLAGRTMILKLLPFTFQEIAGVDSPTTDEWLHKGGFPGIFSEKTPPYLFHQNYVETYIERDLRQLIQIKDLIIFRKFLRLAAGRIGQLLNLHALAGEVGVSSKTIRSWISILEASFIAFLLPPFFENRGKRLIKSPKLFFYDTGLAAYLLGIETAQHMSRDPLRGALFENLAVSEMVKLDYNAGRNPNIYFYRDSTGIEVDIVRESGRDLTLCEVKSSATFHSEFLKGMRTCSTLYTDRVIRQILIYDGVRQRLKHFDVINIRQIKELETKISLMG